MSKALDTLHRYEATHSLSDLNAAKEEMFSAFEGNAQEGPTKLTAERRAVVSAYSKLFRAMQDSYDSSFDPKNSNDLPSTCVVPSSGHYPCGVSANAITDPTERSQYVAAINANERNAERAAKYSGLATTEQGARVGLGLILQSISDMGAPPDKVALEGIVATSGLSTDRQKAIDALF